MPELLTYLFLGTYLRPLLPANIVVQCVLRHVSFSSHSGIMNTDSNMLIIWKIFSTNILSILHRDYRLNFLYFAFKVVKKKV